MLTKFLTFIKYRLNPLDPSLDVNDKESRQNWILYMARRDGKYPVSEVYEVMVPHVSKVTVNKDFQFLESDGLIKRERDPKTGKSYIIPLFEDSGVEKVNKSKQYRQMIMTWGPYGLSGILLIILVTLYSLFS